MPEKNKYIVNGKKYILIYLVSMLLLSYCNVAYAANQAYDYSQGGTNPVSSQIKQYLCAPTETPPASQTVATGNSLSGLNPLSSATVAVQTAQLSYNSGAANVAQNDLYTCINKLYKFAIVIGSVMAVFFIVIAGYLYISSGGSSESVDKAKSILEKQPYRFGHIVCRLYFS